MTNNIISNRTNKPCDDNNEYYNNSLDHRYVIGPQNELLGKEHALNKSKSPIQTASQQLKEDQEEWTVECTAEETTLCLAKVKQEVTNAKGETITIRKYYNQARHLMKWIPIARPPPVFIINICDLTPKVRKEIESIINTPKTLQYVLIQAVGRIFENLDFEYYHLSIARNLGVKFKP